MTENPRCVRTPSPPPSPSPAPSSSGRPPARGRCRLADLPAERPRLDDLPIPEHVAPGPGWSPLMREIAAHIGARATLRLLAQFGGLRLYVPMKPAGWRVALYIGADKAAILARVFGREVLALPTARHALEDARRAGVVAEVRNGLLSLNRAAWILRVNRAYVARLAQRAPAAPAPPPPAGPHQLSLF